MKRSRDFDLLCAFEHDGLVFDVVDRGPRRGRVVLLLHGFPAGSVCWSELAGYLASSGYRSVALEQRGYSSGARPTTTGAYRAECCAGDALALIAQLSSRPVHVIGHDWGALIGWHMAAHHPESVASLVALSTPHPAAFQDALTESSQAVRSLYALGFQLPVLPELTLRLAHGAPLRAALRMSGLSDEWADRYTVAMLEPGRLHAAINWYRAARPGVGSKHHRVLPDVHVPTTFVWGSHDVSVAEATVRRSAEHVTGPYQEHRLDGCTHWIPELHAARAWPHIATHLAHRDAAR